MAFYDRFIELCDQHKTSPAAVVKKIGLSNAITTYWKQGSIPRSDTMEKLAKYFNVSTDYLMGTKPLPTIAIPIEENGSLVQMVGPGEQEFSAIIQYIDNMGYQIYSDGKIQEYNKKHGTQWDFYLFNKRDGKRYFINDDDIERIQKSTNDFLKFQFSELIDTLTEHPFSQVDNCDQE